MVDDAAFGDDGGDEFCGGDVECGVHHADVGVGAQDALETADFAGISFFDFDQVARGEVAVKGGVGRGDVKGDAVVAGQDRELIGADFVSGVAARGDAVGSGDDSLNQAAAHDAGGHVVGHEFDGDASQMQF